MKKPQKEAWGTIYKGLEPMNRGELDYVQLRVNLLGLGVELEHKFIVVASVVQSMPLARCTYFVDFKVTSVWVDDHQAEAEDTYSST